VHSAGAASPLHAHKRAPIHGLLDPCPNRIPGLPADNRQHTADSRVAILHLALVPVLTVIFGLSGALVFGAADFLGGIASKRISPLRVAALSASVGTFVLLAILPLTGGTWSSQAIWLGVWSGVSGAIAIALLYGCLAIGPMSILSPLTAVVSAVVPLTAGLLRGESLPPIGYLAIAIALIAVVLVGFVPEKSAVRPSLKAVLMAIGSGVGIGIFLIVIDLTPHDSGPVPLVFNRIANAAIMFTTIGVLAIVARRKALPDKPRTTVVTTTVANGWRAGLVLAVVCGTVDAVGNVLLLLGLRLGDLTVISAEIYPAGTILLAATVLRERIAPIQIIGLVLAVAAAAMLALA
jgi:drug/metabolite transporter (DMT)-like permease